MPALHAGLEAEIDRHWAAACARSRLFNGRIFCADRITPWVIEGHWTEYRRITAQMADHGLVPRVSVRSLAVCGVLCGPDGVAVGRRERTAAYQPGEWQLPPAGSVDVNAATADGADWRRALYGELREELGIEPGDVTGMRPLCLVQHPSGVTDMGVQIDTGLSGAEILARQRGAADQEYDRMMVVPAAEVAARVAAEEGSLVPPALAFLSRVRW